MFCARDGAGNFALIAASILLAVSRSLCADAPATQPTTMPAVTRSALENIELGRKNSPQRTLTNPTNGDSGMMRVVGALGVVIGSILIVRWASRKFFGLQAGGIGSGPVQVLSRMAIAPRQQLMLIQVGRRIVLVGNCGTSMNPLCEISDADEVAALAGELQQKKRTSATSAFLSIFGKAGAKFEAEQQEASPA